MQNGTYFVTVCTKQRHPLFGVIQDGKMALSENGKHVRQCIESIETIYPSVLLDAFVIMPNHVHLLLTFMNYDTNPSHQRVTQQLKSAATKQIGFSPWQEKSYTNAILTARTYRLVQRYIRENPLKWETDQFALPSGE
jgi:REP element-mobilizing transposase RayT